MPEASYRRAGFAKCSDSYGYRPSHGSLGTKQRLELFLAYHIAGLFISYSLAYILFLLLFLSLYTCYLVMFFSQQINQLRIVVLAGMCRSAVCYLWPFSHLKIISDTLLFNIWFILGIGSSNQVRVFKFILLSVCGLFTKQLHL